MIQFVVVVVLVLKRKGLGGGEEEEGIVVWIRLQVGINVVLVPKEQERANKKAAVAGKLFLLPWQDGRKYSSVLVNHRNFDEPRVDLEYFMII
jgi:hypothetical protein